jgi:hypothetical protein
VQRAVLVKMALGEVAAVVLVGSMVAVAQMVHVVEVVVSKLG